MNIKKTLFNIFLILGLVIVFNSHAVFAQNGRGMMGNTETDGLTGDSDDHLSIASVLPDILEKYGVQSAKNLDCKKLTAREFETIGDAVMEDIHPGDAHEQMDEMMGGEGSDSLEAMHVQMGKNYLGCNSSGNFSFGQGMMGGTWGLNNNSTSMMGWGRTVGYSWIWTLSCLVLYLSAVSFMILGSVFFWKRIKK